MIEIRRLSPDGGQDIYDMPQSIPDAENGFTSPAHDLSYDEV